MTSTKTLLRSLLLATIVCVAPAMAFATTENDKNKENKEQCDQDNKDKKAEPTQAASEKPKAVNYAASSQKSREIIPGLSNKSDSSSVLSYNFIFYLVYKFKYSESEEEFAQESRTTD